MRYGGNIEYIESYNYFEISFFSIVLCGIIRDFAYWLHFMGEIDVIQT